MVSCLQQSSWRPPFRDASRHGAYLLTAVLLRCTCRSFPPSGCTFPWDTAGHLSNSVAKTAELRQPLFGKRPKESVATRGLLGAMASAFPAAKRTWLCLALLGSCCGSVLSSAMLMGGGQAVLWGRAVGLGGSLLGPT